MGMWIETVAQGWLVLELTNSAFLLGLSAAGRGAATLLFGALGGVAADMADRRRVMIFVQLVSAATAFAISFLVVTELIQFWHILALGFLNGAANAANQPARQSYIYDLVSREHLSKAVALNSMANHATRIVGPFSSGLLIAFLGIEGCFFLNGVSRLAAALAVVTMPKDSKTIVQSGSVWANLKEGFEYVWGNRLVLSLVGTEVLADTFAFSYRFMLPVFARDVLGVGPIGLGPSILRWARAQWWGP